MNKNILIIGGIIVIGIILALTFSGRRDGAVVDDAGQGHDSEEAMMSGEEGMKGEEMMTMEAETMEGGEMMLGESYQGEVLAGKRAKLLDFNEADYKTALGSGKVVALYFYANWCPTCKKEFPKMQASFDKLDTDGVVGFRVNFNDSETDDAEKMLAREFGVAYQHTKVFLVDGKRVLKSPESWGEDRYTSEINKLLN